MNAGRAGSKTVGIIDYRMGNLASVSKAIENAGGLPVVSDQTEELSRSDLVVLPGVGNFAAGMHNLEDLGLTDFVVEWAESGRPLLGVCVGMQLLFEESDEGPAKGLGILKGRVEKFDERLKVPHMGWNTLERRGDSIFSSFDDRYFYFVHSYYCVPDDEGIVAARTDYGVEFASAVHQGSVFGVQFHPEKSSDDGLALYRRVLEEVG
ncbi:MAG TPA: imidazole glycerol phosphate synthase subunit HisH [Actinomycetota bacterium]|nr:imidazole glycerol phosphate synthase subunit HisH [Actinomycetota bacterium]